MKDKKIKYTQRVDGEWIRPTRKNYFIKCCDCGLEHKIDLRIKNKHIEFRAFMINKEVKE